MKNGFHFCSVHLVREGMIHWTNSETNRDMRQNLDQTTDLKRVFRMTYMTVVSVMCFRGGRKLSWNWLDTPTYTTAQNVEMKTARGYQNHRCQRFSSSANPKALPQNMTKSKWNGHNTYWRSHKTPKSLLRLSAKHLNRIARENWATTNHKWGPSPHSFEYLVEPSKYFQRYHYRTANSLKLFQVIVGKIQYYRIPTQPTSGTMSSIHV